MKTEHDNVDSTRKNSRTFIVIANIFFVMLAIPGIMFAFKSFILFDSLGAESNPVVLTMFLSVVSFPVLVFFSLGSWVLYAYKKYKASVIISLLPFVNVLIIAIITFISMAFFSESLNWFIN